MQQFFDLQNGIENYVTTFFWLCIIYQIEKNEKNNKKFIIK